MKPFVGIFEDAVSQIVNSIPRDHDTPLFIAVRGSNLSGKSSVSMEAMRGQLKFLESLKDVRVAVVTGYDDLSREEASLVADYVLSVRMGVYDGPGRIWLIPSTSRLHFTDEEIFVSDLNAYPETRLKICCSLVEGFPCDPDCPVKDLLFHSSGKLSIGELDNLVQVAKSLALSAETPSLSCSHLSKAFHSMALPVTAVPVHPRRGSHSCEFVSTVSTNVSLESYIGLSDEKKECITSFINAKVRCKMLLISGPIGCGKSHLASAIAWNATRPPNRVTAADILRSKIGETEKALFTALSSGSRVIIEDIEKLFPADSSEATGSVQRCLSVFVSFIDRIRFGQIHADDFMVIGTTRSVVDSRIDSKVTHLQLTNRLSVTEKVDLIKSVYPDYDASGVSGFDLINLSNRSACVELGRDRNMDCLRQAIQSNMVG